MAGELSSAEAGDRRWEDRANGAQKVGGSCGWRARLRASHRASPQGRLSLARSALACSHCDYRAGRIPSSRRGVRDGTKPLPGLGRLQDSAHPRGQAGFPPSLSPSRVSPAARRRPRRLPMAAYSADRHGASGKAEALEHSMSLSAATRTQAAPAGGACAT